MDGVKPVEPMTDAISVFARSITDIQLVATTLGVMRHQLSPDISQTNLSQCRFGFFKTDLFDSLGSESVKMVWEKAKGALRDSGALVEDLDLGPEFDGWEGVGGKIGKIMDSAADVSTFGDYTANRNRVSETILDRAKNVVPRTEVVKIYNKLAALRPKFDAIAGQYDAIITLPTLVEAPKLSANDVPDFAALWSCLHVPALCLPGFAGVNGLPIGLTMVAPRYVDPTDELISRYHDERLLHIAKLIAGVFIKAGKDALRKVPVPEGAVHLKP
jgi:Asp-tRNA(Asn)/Glu-tRNA(Gln) amidotransferase A subunit family amidase